MKNYMIAAPTEEDVSLASDLCSNDSIFSDGTRLCNAEKWKYSGAILERGEATLFSPISYEDIYLTDDTVKCLAAAYVADLRLQFLSMRLIRNPADMVAHKLYLSNAIWMSKLNQRAQLDDQEARVLT